MIRLFLIFLLSSIFTSAQDSTKTEKAFFLYIDRFRRTRQWFTYWFSLTVISCILFIQNSMAQNSYYWSQQYGNKSLLLSGAVVGSVKDLGSVYYNPGFLGLQKNPAFMISAKVMQFSSVKIKNGLGDEVDLSKSQFGQAPSLIAGIFKIKKLPKHTFAYSILTRRTQEIDLLFRTQSTVDVLVNFEGDEIFTGEVNWLGKATEQWLGLTWSFAPHPKVSVGFSNFVSASNSKMLLDIDLNALASDNHVVTFKGRRQLEFKQYGLLWKAGLAMDFSPVTAGIVVTTPKLNLAGNGFFLTETILAGADTNYTKAGENIFEANLQEDIDAKRKSSWSLAVGAGLHFKRAVIHISGEWFNKVNKYTIMEPEPFIGQSTGDTIATSLVEQLDQVVNAGIGLELLIKENLRFYASFATDFSAAKPDANWFTELKSEVDNTASRADVFHIAGGVGFTVKGIEITLGTSFNSARDEITRPVNLPDGKNETIFDPAKTATLKLQNWKILFGFSIPFSNKNKKESDETEKFAK